MKLIFYGDESETAWFKKRFDCPNAVPCPRVKQMGAQIDSNYPCRKCAFNVAFGEYTNVTYNPPQSDTADVVKCLHDYMTTVKQCSDCVFYSDGKCQFNYNCPADFDVRGEKHL